NEADFANHLQEQGYTPELCLEHANIEDLRKEYNNNNFFEETAKRSGFDPNETKEWMKVGLEPKDTEFANENYPKNQRKEITKLNISSKNLQGILDLSDFVNLEELNCSGNKLTFLKLDNCLKLRRIYCGKNNFPEQDLSMFSHLVNLEKLWMDNNRFIVAKKVNTPFYQQYQKIVTGYDTFSQNTPYQIKPGIITTSKLINTKEIIKELQISQTSSDSKQVDFQIPTEELNQLNLSENQSTEQPRQQAQILQTNPPKTS
ncbi:4245_t:CDS:2, partial [Racocetra persica]